MIRDFFRKIFKNTQISVFMKIPLIRRKFQYESAFKHSRLAHRCNWGMLRCVTMQVVSTFRRNVSPATDYFETSENSHPATQRHNPENGHPQGILFYCVVCLVTLACWNKFRKLVQQNLPFSAHHYVGLNNSITPKHKSGFSLFFSSLQCGPPCCGAPL